MDQQRIAGFIDDPVRRQAKETHWTAGDVWINNPQLLESTKQLEGVRQFTCGSKGCGFSKVSRNPGVDVIEIGDGRFEQAVSHAA